VDATVLHFSFHVGLFLTLLMDHKHLIPANTRHSMLFDQVLFHAIMLVVASLLIKASLLLAACHTDLILANNHGAAIAL
jgi:hypothetical protein